MSDIPHLLSATEVARVLGITRETVWRRVQRRQLIPPLYPAPRSARWRADEIHSLIDRLSGERSS